MNTYRPDPVALTLTEILAVSLWSDLALAEQTGPDAELASLGHACSILHGVRMTHTGAAEQAANLLIRIALTRMSMLRAEAARTHWRAAA